MLGEQKEALDRLQVAIVNREMDLVALGARSRLHRPAQPALLLGNVEEVESLDSTLTRGAAPSAQWTSGRCFRVNFSAIQTQS